MPRISSQASNAPSALPSWPRILRSRDHSSLSRALAKRAGDDVGMAVEIFGRRMHDDVGAERERTREDRRRHGGVDAQDRVGGVRDLGDRGDVGDGPERIARRLDPEQSGLAGPHRGAHGVEIGGLDETDAVAVTADLAQP